MILIQVILLVALGILLTKFLANPFSSKMSAWKKIISFIFAILAACSIIIPDFATRAANVVGVGRGADLLLYILTLAFVFLSIDLYLRGKQDQRRLVELSRKLAIIEANYRETSVRSAKRR